MSRGLRLAALVLAGGLLLTGCAGGDELGDTADGVSGGVPAGGLGEPAGEQDDLERLGDVPEECAEAMPYLLGPADFADMDAPADWPGAPAGATLCVTSSGELASAIFVTGLPFDEVVAHYEAALPAGYESFRKSGEENGTGYASLDGASSELMFQIRENDTGFVVVLDRGAP